ncbi:cysteine-rich DPF motif domain-containing protein 1 [Arctopsyche grandis]|uniref:cysteine-rich DPF motif domain-containing protein 1 n=1 Tax=Arctopsyche grandis TaxID=121162 RepID=UPI00406D856D
MSTKPSKTESSKPEKVVFLCKLCGMKENVDYKGTKPYFAKSVLLKEDSYVMKDPFSTARRGQILIVGSNCCACDQMVCHGKECSVFYTKTFCTTCAKQKLESFPTVIQNKINSC